MRGEHQATIDPSHPIPIATTAPLNSHRCHTSLRSVTPKNPTDIIASAATIPIAAGGAIHSARKFSTFGPWIYEQCTTAGIGCVDCKAILADAVNDTFRELRARRAELAATPGDVRDILADGADRARTIARDVLHEVQDRMGLPPAATRY